jgi:tetratricopeptide (TPR) repeat protein
MADAEANIPELPPQFYLVPAIQCLDLGQYEMARPWLDHVIAHSPPETMPLLVIGEMLSMTSALDMAEDYFNQAIAANQNPGSAHTSLCVIALRQGDRDKAQEHLDKASRIARKTHDFELEQQIASARGMFNMPAETLNFMLSNPIFRDGPFGNFGPGGFLDDEYYLDDDDYDEEFGNDFFDLY